MAKKNITKEKSQEIIEICKKYLSTKSLEFRLVVLNIYINKEMFSCVEENSLNSIKECFLKSYEQSQEIVLSNAHKYDEVMLLQNTCNYAVQFIQDLEKIKKIIEKGEKKVNYIELIKLSADLVNEDLTTEINKVTIPAYKRISKITTHKKEIVKEFIKMGYGAPSEIIIKNLFDKFMISYSNEEITILLKQCIEEVELDEFEKNLGTKTHKKIGSFESLNGYQFEDYLKELLLELGYQVIRTKSSGDQGADLIIKKDNEKTVVQAKKYSGSVTNKAIQEIVASKQHYEAEKALVITTGKFTKSAIELAKSNKVEIWDNKKLNEIIASINNKNVTQIREKQKCTLKEDCFTFVCPFCEYNINFLVSDLPPKGANKDLYCPECICSINISLQDNDYACSACKKSFNDVKSKIKHTEKCEKIKERKFFCILCKNDVWLDDSEFQEINEKGSAEIECWSCNKIIVLKKK